MDLTEVHDEELRREVSRRYKLTTDQENEERLKRYMAAVAQITKELRETLQLELGIPLNDDDLDNIIVAVDKYHEDHPYT